MKSLTWLVLTAFLAAGCASEKQWTNYHSSIDKQTAALLRYSETQATQKATNRALMMQTYSASMVNAAATQAATDDVLLAFAWGVEVATPDPFIQPDLPHIVAPDKSSDLVRAWTPIVGMVVPFLWAIPFANNNGGGGTSISADNGAEVLLDSGNAGSYNIAGRDQSIPITADGSSNIGAKNNSAPLDVDIEGDAGGDSIDDVCLIDPDGLACVDCSCSSLAEGSCACPVLY